MIKYEFVSLEDNLIDIVFYNHLKDKTAIVFPNNSSKNAAMETIQGLWQLQDIILLTFDDLSKFISLSEKPILQDVKRLLAFFKSLSLLLKEKYYITDYFSSINFANIFFKLFEELKEECVLLDKIEDTLLNESIFSDWQIETWQDLLLIYNEYKEYLKKTDFTDVIFTEYNVEAIDIYLKGYDNVMFVNQFYFTESEKRLIKILGSTKEVILFFQIPETILEKSTLSISDFNISDLINTKNSIEMLKPTTANGRGVIHLYSFDNDFSMLNKAVEVIEKESIENIVDYDFYEHSWFRFLSNEKFALPQSFSFHNSEIFYYFNTLYTLFDSMQYIELKKKYLFPLNEVFNFLIGNAKPEHAQDSYHASLVKLFTGLASRGYLYFDPLEASILLKEISCPSLIKKLSETFDLILKLLKIKQMNQLINLIDIEGGINIKSICNSDSLTHTNILEVFFECLSNLYNIQEFGIIHDWNEIFPHNPSRPIIIYLLKFFVEFLKPSLVSFKSQSQGKANFRTLLDTRNLIYDKVIVLNAIEGVVPKSKSIDFLFNEKQRKIIGLKTYHEIRLREKYYFLRLILASSDSHIFYIENDEENIEKSSFVEELEISLPQSIRKNKYKDIGYVSFYQNSPGNMSMPRPTKEYEHFHYIPSDFENDFKEPYTIKLNTYTLMELIKDPMYWFFNSNLGFNKIQYPEKDRMNNKILGIIVHSFIELLYKKIALNKNRVIFKDFKKALNNKNFDEVYEELIYKRKMTKFPHDFSGSYFKNVLYPFIKDKIKKYFLESEIANLSDDSMIEMETTIPDTMFLDTDYYKVYLTGKPDMVISSTDFEASEHISFEKKKIQISKYIIDFKTGKEDKNQLYLYQWLMSENEKIRSAAYSEMPMESYEESIFKYSMRFFSVFNPTIVKPLDNPIGSINDIKEKLKETLDMCYKNGYFFPRSRHDRETFRDVSRVDLLRNDQ